MTPAISNHARVRMQQRGISKDALELLLDYGRRVHDHRGAVICYLDKTARHEIGRGGKADVIRRCGSSMDAYLVLSTDGEVVTVVHRFQRIWQH